MDLFAQLGDLLLADGAQARHFLFVGLLLFQQHGLQEGGIIGQVVGGPCHADHHSGFAGRWQLGCAGIVKRGMPDRRADVVPIQQPVELSGRQRAVQRITGPDKAVLFQALVPKHEAIVLPAQDLQLVATAVAEHEQRVLEG